MARHPNQHSHWGRRTAPIDHDKRRAEEAAAKTADLDRYEELRKSRPMKPPGKRGQQ